MANDMRYTVNVDQTRMLPRNLNKTPNDLVVMGHGALCANERIQPLLLAHLPSQLVPLPLKKGTWSPHYSRGKGMSSLCSL